MSPRSQVADVSGGPIKGDLGNPLVSLSKDRREPVLCRINTQKAWRENRTFINIFMSQVLWLSLSPAGREFIEAGGGRGRRLKGRILRVCLRKWTNLPAYQELISIPRVSLQLKCFRCLVSKTYRLTSSWKNCKLLDNDLSLAPSLHPNRTLQPPAVITWILAFGHQTVPHDQ